MAAANGGFSNLTGGQFASSFVGGAILGNLVQGFGVNIWDAVGVGVDLVSDETIIKPHGPGMWYDSEDAAAAGWARYYGSESMSKQKEYGSVIYYFKVKNKIMYSFSPSLKEKIDVNGKQSIPFDNEDLNNNLPSYAPKGSIVCGSIHSHPNNCIDANANFSDDTFNSKGDRGGIIANNPNKNHYLLNFYGNLLVCRRERDAETVGKQEDVVRDFTIGYGFAENFIKCGSSAATAYQSGAGAVVNDHFKSPYGKKTYAPVGGKLVGPSFFVDN